MTRQASVPSILLAIAALGMLSSTPTESQATGTVVVELRISSNAIKGVNDPATAGSQDLVVHGKNPTEDKLVELARREFAYLAWVPNHLAASQVGPRLILELRDRVIAGDPVCTPRKVTARLLAKPRATEIEVPGELEFSGICNVLLKQMTAAEFVAKLGILVEGMLQTEPVRTAIEKNLAFEVPLARALVSDEASQRLFLPVANLHARKESKIEVRFGDDENRFLWLHPFTQETDRTLVKVKDFACDDITAQGSIADTFGAFWHPSLPNLLALCGEPLAYMKHYEPSTPVEGRLSPPVDTGGATPARPGLVTDLGGDQP